MPSIDVEFLIAHGDESSLNIDFREIIAERMIETRTAFLIRDSCMNM
jgi:hypothetical protein